MQLVHGLIDGLLKHADEARVDAHGLEKVDLGLGLWEAVKDPTIDTAVTLANSLIDEAQYDLIRHGGTALSSLL